MILTVITFLVILSILVLIHECGHFFMARFFGVGVEEFGLGLPPRIFGKKVRSTIYSVNWLPIGGFVRLAGEDDEDHDRAKIKSGKLREYFWMRSKKERAAILLAGVAMNFVLAVGITSYLLTKGDMEPVGEVRITQVIAGSPAEASGLKENDIVKAVSVSDGTKRLTKVMRFAPELIGITAANEGKELVLTVLRNGSEFTFVVVPRKSDPNDPKTPARMGIQISDMKYLQFPWYRAPWEATKINVIRAKEMLVSLGILFWRLVTFQPLQADVAGPIGIAQVTGQAVQFGFDAVIKFMSILSLNLAVLNVLPIPALDGGRLAFVFLEKILGRRIRPAFEKSTHQIGMIILFALILLISINDILRIAGRG